MSTDTIKLPCISLWQPWCYWVSLGWKTVETRLHTRFANLKGQRIGIHAAMKWDTEALLAARDYLTEKQKDATRDFLRVGGHIVCTAFVKDACWLNERDSLKALIDCASVPRFGLVLTDIKPVPVTDATCVKGRQGLFYVDVPAALEAAQ